MSKNLDCGTAPDGCHASDLSAHANPLPYVVVRNGAQPAALHPPAIADRYSNDVAPISVEEDAVAVGGSGTAGCIALPLHCTDEISFASGLTPGAASSRSGPRSPNPPSSAGTPFARTSTIRSRLDEGPAPTSWPLRRGKREQSIRKSSLTSSTGFKCAGPMSMGRRGRVMDEAAASRCSCSRRQKRRHRRRRDDEGWLDVWGRGDEVIPSKRRRNDRWNSSCGDAAVATVSGRQTRCSWFDR